MRSLSIHGRDMNIVEEQRMKYPNHKPWMIAHGPASNGATAQTLVEIISYPFKAAYDLIDGAYSW